MKTNSQKTPVTSANKSFSLATHVILIVIGLVFMKAYLSSNQGQDWNNRISRYYEEQTKINTMTERQLMEYRNGTPYVVSMEVKKLVDANPELKNEVFFFPPNDLMRKELKINVTFPEPIVFYNFTGLKSVWLNSPNGTTASVYINVFGEKISLEKIRDQEHLNQIKQSFKQYEYSL